MDDFNKYYFEWINSLDEGHELQFDEWLERKKRNSRKSEKKSGLKLKRGIVYLYHFSEPYKHAQHYSGWTLDLDARDKRHHAGRGNPLVKAVLQAGITIAIVKVWRNKPKGWERNIKKHQKRYCLQCQ